MFVFNFGVESLGQSVKLGRQFPPLFTIFSKPKTKSGAFYSVFVVKAIFQLLNCCFGGERKPI